MLGVVIFLDPNFSVNQMCFFSNFIVEVRVFCNSCFYLEIPWEEYDFTSIKRTFCSFLFIVN